MGFLGWLIEQVCRVADARVCALANLTDEDGTASVASARVADPGEGRAAPA